MIYLVIHKITGERFEFIDNLDAARAKMQEIKASVVASEGYRFTVVKEIVDGENVTWVPTDLDTETEDGRFQVFNTFTGQHESFDSLAAAKSRKQQLIDTFIDELGLNGEPIDKEELERALAASQLSFKNAQSMREAATLEVTRLGD